MDSVHRRTFGQWFISLFYGPTYPRRDTGWKRQRIVEQPSVTPSTAAIYPVPVAPTPAAGRSVRLVQSTGSMAPVSSQDELSLSQLNQLTDRLAPVQIAALPTLPDKPAANRTGMLPNNSRPSASRPPHSNSLRPLTEAEASPPPVFLGNPQSHSSPLHGTWQAGEKAEDTTWLTGPMPIKSTPSGFLLDSPAPKSLVMEEEQKAEIFAVTEEDCQPDLSEGEEPTLQVPKELRGTPSLYILLQKSKKESE